MIREYKISEDANRNIYAMRGKMEKTSKTAVLGSILILLTKKNLEEVSVGH